MTELTMATTAQAGATDSGSVTPALRQAQHETQAAGTPPPALRQDSGQATSTPAGATPEIDWTKLDWDAHADKIPWDKIDAKRIDKIPSVQKMQASLRRQQAEIERRAKERESVLTQQLQQMQSLIAGQDPELAQQAQGIQAQGQYLQMQQQLERYQEMEARKLLAEKYEIPEEVVFGFAGGPEEVMTQVLDYQRLNRVQTQSTLEGQLQEMKRQLEALTRRTTDPAANQDIGVAAPAGNHYQNEWERLMKDGRGDEAEKIRRDAFQKGVAINVETMKPKHWA